MPVLNPNTPINRGFDDYKLVADHNSLEAILDEKSFVELYFQIIAVQTF